jgi:phage terminase small subunit
VPKKKIPSVGQVPRKDDALPDPREEQFCWLYLQSYNAAQAYRKAFPSEVRNPSSARVYASKLLAKDNIVARIGAIQGQRLKVAKADAVRVMQELACIAFTRADDYVQVDGGSVRVRDTADMSRATLAAIQSVEETTTEHGGTVKIKMHDKVKALQLLKEMAGMAQDAEGTGPGISDTDRELKRSGLREALRRKAG